jgi:hypothetical protein
MRCRFAPIEQAGSSQEHCARADRAYAPNSSSDFPDPLDCFNAYLIVLNGTSTSYEQGIDLPADPPKRLMR